MSSSIKDSPTLQFISRYGEWILLGLTILTVLFIRFRLASMPLERDEGEYAYIAQGMLEGNPPYTKAYSMKFPGIDIAYLAIFKLLGSNYDSIRIALAFINLLTAGMVFMIGYRLKNQSLGIWAAMVFLVLTLSSQLLGLTANCEHFILLPVSIGIFLLLLNPGITQSMAAGFFFGLALCIKQQALFFALFGFLAAAVSPFKNRFHTRREIFLSSLFFGMGFCIPLLIMLIWIQRIGVWPAFKFWCFDYAKHYGNMWNLQDAGEHFSRSFFPFVQGHLLILIAVVAGFAAMIQGSLSSFTFIVGCGFFSFLAVCPGLNFRPHYFLFMVPFFSLSSAWFFSASRICRIIGLAALLFPLGLQKNVFFRADPESAVKILYPYSPFQETRQVAYWLKTTMGPNDRVGILGSEPEIPFYAGRKLATPYIYMYPLMEPQPFASGMQKNFMDLMEKRPPEYLIHVRVPSSWLVYPNSDIQLLEWIPSFLKSHYDQIQVIPVQARGIPSAWNIILYRNRKLAPASPINFNPGNPEHDESPKTSDSLNQ